MKSAVRYTADHILDYIELNEEYGIFELTVPAEWAGKSVGQLDVRKKMNISIMALKKNGKMNLEINSGTYINGDESMLVLGNVQEIQKAFKL